MKFRYLIANTMNGNILGTNDEDTARGYAQSEDFFVGDAEKGLWLSGEDDQPIPEAGEAA